MTFLKICFHVFLAVIVTSAAACTDSGAGPTAPADTAPKQTYQASGEVRDDGCLLPDGAAPCSPVADARVEVLDGPSGYVFAMTGPDGKFSLGPLVVGGQQCVIIAGCTEKTSTISVRKEGWTTHTNCCSLSSRNPVQLFQLGKEPHVLWGYVYFPGNQPRMPAPGVRVEITGGTNAGKVVLTDNSGLYRFDDLLTSELFAIEFSLNGYRTSRWGQTYLRTNFQFGEVLSK